MNKKLDDIQENCIKKQNEIVVEPYHHIYYDSFPANVSSAYFDPSTFSILTYIK